MSPTNERSLTKFIILFNNKGIFMCKTLTIHIAKVLIKRKQSTEVRRVAKRNNQRRRRISRSQLPSESLTNNDITITQMHKFDRQVWEITYVCCNTCHLSFADIILNILGSSRHM